MKRQQDAEDFQDLAAYLINPTKAQYRVWQLDASRENRLIARPVSMIAAHRLIAQADPLKYTYALLWTGDTCTYLFGKIANQLSSNDHRVAAYKLLVRRRK